MEKQNFTRQEVLDIITEIDDKGIDNEAVTYNQILDTIVNKLGQNKQLIIPVVVKSLPTDEEIYSKGFQYVREIEQPNRQLLITLRQTFKAGAMFVKKQLDD